MSRTHCRRATRLPAKNPDPAAPLRLVTPASVTLTGDGIDDLGQEPQTQAHIYNLTDAGVRK